MGQYSKYSQLLKETQNTPLKLHNPQRMAFNSRKFIYIYIYIYTSIGHCCGREGVMCTLLSWSDTIKKEKGITVQNVVKSE